MFGSSLWAGIAPPALLVSVSLHVQAQALEYRPRVQIGKKQFLC